MTSAQIGGRLCFVATSHVATIAAAAHRIDPQTAARTSR